MLIVSVHVRCLCGVIICEHVQIITIMSTATNIYCHDLPVRKQQVADIKPEKDIIPRGYLNDLKMYFPKFDCSHNLGEIVVFLHILKRNRRPNRVAGKNNNRFLST